MRKTNRPGCRAVNVKVYAKLLVPASILRSGEKKIPSLFFRRLSVRKSQLGGLGLFAEEPIYPGELILRLGGCLVGRRTATDRNVIRLGKRLFLTESGDLDDYINHSCVPNCCVDFDNLYLVTLRSIGKGEEITFNYCTTEYEIDPTFRFVCRCGYERCPGIISGYRYLDASERKRLKPYLSPFLKRRA